MKASRKMYKIVAEILGNDFEERVKRGEHLHKKLEAPAMMPLVVEAWQEGNEVMVSIAHYGEVNGDAMRDPEIVYRVYPVFSGMEWKNALQPLEYQNDYLMQYKVAVELENGSVSFDPQLLSDLVAFSNTWADNIKNNGYI